MIYSTQNVSGCIYVENNCDFYHDNDSSFSLLFIDFLQEVQHELSDRQLPVFITTHTSTRIWGKLSRWLTSSVCLSVNALRSNALEYGQFLARWISSLSYWYLQYNANNRMEGTWMWATYRHRLRVYTVTIRGIQIYGLCERMDVVLN